MAVETLAQGSSGHSNRPADSRWPDKSQALSLSSGLGTRPKQSQWRKAEREKEWAAAANKPDLAGDPGLVTGKNPSGNLSTANHHIVVHIDSV